MGLKDLAQKISREIKNNPLANIVTKDPYLSILNKICLFSLQTLCNEYAKSNDEISFDRKNPFISFIVEANELITRVKKSDIVLRDPDTNTVILAEELVKMVGDQIANCEKAPKNVEFATMQREHVHPRVVPLVRMNVIARLLLAELKSLPKNETAKTDKRLQLASDCVIASWEDFLKNLSSSNERFSRLEAKKAVDKFISIWKQIGGSIADITNSKTPLSSNKFCEIIANYYILADVAANLDYINHDRLKLIKCADEGDGPRGAKGANKRLLDFISDHPRLRTIQVNAKITKSITGLAQYDFTDVEKDLVGEKDPFQRTLILFKVGRLYINDRENYFFSNNEKVLAAYWMLDFLMSEDSIRDIRTKIPDCFKKVCEEGELKNLLTLFESAGKLQNEAKQEKTTKFACK